MSKNKFEVVDYEDAVRLYGDIEFTFYDYWKHSFRYDNEELGLRSIVTGKQIGRASCRERVSSPV